MRWVLVLLTALTACGGGQSTDSPPVPSSFDFESSVTGLRASVDPDALDGQTAYRLGSDVDLWYQTSLVCMSSNGWGTADVPGPIVHLVRDKVTVDGVSYDGWTDYGTDTITMRAITANIWAHEFVHYLLNKAGLENTHANPAFQTCSV